MKDKNRCLWCGRSEGEVKRLFAGPTPYLCDCCVEQMAAVLRGEDSGLAAKVREEIDQAVQESFQRLVQQLHLGPLHEKYQRLMRVKFKEEPGSPTFEEVFHEFKKGVEAVVAADDYQTRYDLAIAYHEMGLAEDAYREMIQSLTGAVRQKDFERASEVMSALLYIHKDSARVIRDIFRALGEGGVS